MTKKYLIRDGFSFVEPDATVKTGGDTIELPDDVAAEHLHKLVLLDADVAVLAPAAASVPLTAASPVAADPVVAPESIAQPGPVAAS